MSTGYQQSPFGRKVTILDDNKYCLYGDPIEGGLPNKPPKLFFSFKANYPHIKIKLNNGKRGDEANIDIPLDLLAVYSIIEVLHEVANSREPKIIAVAAKRTSFDKEKGKHGDPYVHAMIYIGRDNDGEVFIGVQRGRNEQSKNFLKMKFRFMPPEFHPIMDTSGTVLGTPQLSSIMARSWVRLLNQLVAQINLQVWDYAITAEGKFELKRKSEQDSSGGNGGYGGNRGGYNNNNGGYNNNRGNNSGYSDYANNRNNTPPPEPQSNDKPYEDELPW